MLQSHFSLDISARYFEIAPRSQLSRHERVWCGEIALRSRRGVDISTRNFTISPRWWLSRRDLADLGAISARLPRSHRGLLFSARYFEISARSWLSRRDLADLGEIAAISPRSRSNFYKGTGGQRRSTTKSREVGGRRCSKNYASGLERTFCFTKCAGPNKPYRC